MKIIATYWDDLGSLLFLFFGQRVRKKIKFGRSDVQMWPADCSRRAAIHTRFVITPIFCRPQIAPIYDFRGLLPLGNFSGQFFFSSAAAVIILKKSYLKLSTCRNSQFLVHSTTSSPDGGVNAGKNIETCLTRGKWEIQSYAAPLSDRIWRFENSAPKIDSH